MVTAINVKTKAQHIEERSFSCGDQPIKITITGEEVLPDIARLFTGTAEAEDGDCQK